jgi:hypothetical protein
MNELSDEKKNAIWANVESIYKPPGYSRETDITIQEYADRYNVDTETARTKMKLIAQKSDEFEYTDAIDPVTHKPIKVLRKI